MSMNRRALLSAAAATAFASATPALARTVQTSAPDRAAILATMKRAAAFMTDEAAVGGGYVWNVLPDFSRRWGELEASPTMIWVQPPGTATMGTSSWTPITPPAMNSSTRPPRPPPTRLSGGNIRPAAGTMSSTPPARSR